MSGPAYDPNYPTPPKSSNTWIWVVLIVLLVLVLGCGGLCAGCTYFARQAGQSLVQGVEIAALQVSTIPAIESHTEVQEKIGSVTGTGTPEVVGGYGMEKPTITIKFNITGEKGEAVATVTASREAGSLRPTDIQVKFADGSTVNVPPGEYTPELNFDIETDDSMPADQGTDSGTPTTDDSAAEPESETESN